MTERIQELWAKAVDIAVPETYTSLSWGQIEKIKTVFAELIVAECARVIVNGGYWSGGPLGPKRQCTPPEIATMIKEHFGVEE